MHCICSCHKILCEVCQIPVSLEHMVGSITCIYGPVSLEHMVGSITCIYGPVSLEHMVGSITCMYGMHVERNKAT